jgi:hypothetical protein
MGIVEAGVAALGAVLLCLIVADFLLTTIGASYHAILSHRVARISWHVFRTCLPDWPSARVCIGPIVMTAVAAFWILSTSFAWAMIFQLEDSSIVRTDGASPAVWWMDFAYVGHLLSTLGGSLGKPGDIGWSLAAVMVAVNGMVILTLSVSFVLNTTQAVAEGRAFLATLEALDGKFAADTGIVAQLASLVSNLNSVPLALYYSAPRPSRRLPAGLTRLYEKALKEGDPAALHALRSLLQGLPRFEPEDPEDQEKYLQDLQRWANRYEF